MKVNNTNIFNIANLRCNHHHFSQLITVDQN